MRFKYSKNNYTPKRIKSIIICIHVKTAIKEDNIL